MTSGGLATDWLWDGDRLVAEYDALGALTARYAHGPGPNEPLANWTNRTAPTFFHADHQGSIVALSGTGAVIVGTPHTYSPYGEPDATHGSGGPRFRFTGQTSLTSTVPLWHYKARAYDPTLGRFLQTDPIGYEDSLNLYQYVGNDPFNATDPTGRVAQDLARTQACDAACQKRRQAGAAVSAAEGIRLGHLVAQQPIYQGQSCIVIPALLRHRPSGPASRAWPGRQVADRFEHGGGRKSLKR